MKKWFLPLGLMLMTLTSCLKTDTPTCTTGAPTIVATAAETATLQNYITANSISATQVNGMFYSFTNQGAGTSPSACSVIGVTYAGNIINGTTDGAQFDASPGTAPLNLELNRLIAGWQIVLPLVKTNGAINLYIPPSLGYGDREVRDNAGNVVIPANSYLKFRITLVNVQ